MADLFRPSTSLFWHSILRRGCLRQARAFTVQWKSHNAHWRARSAAGRPNCGNFAEISSALSHIVNRPCPRFGPYWESTSVPVEKFRWHPFAPSIGTFRRYAWSALRGFHAGRRMFDLCSRMPAVGARDQGQRRSRSLAGNGESLDPARLAAAAAVVRR
jgi:hypothetical protein